MACWNAAPAAARDYLRILDPRAKYLETGVDAVLGGSWSGMINHADRRCYYLAHDLGLPRAMEVTITTVDLSMYDRLLRPGRTCH